MLKLKPQYFGHLREKDNSLKKSLVLGNIESRRRRGHPRMRWLDGITDAMDMNLGKLWEKVRDREPDMLQSIGLQRVSMTGHLNNNNMLNFNFLIHKDLRSLHQRAFQARFLSSL